jgi:hypothetical protein
MIRILAAAALAASVFAAPVLAADKPVTIRAVGTWGNLSNYFKHEGPFFNENFGGLGRFDHRRNQAADRTRPQGL